MEHNKLLSEIKVGDNIEGFYVLKNTANKSSASGKPYLSATLFDMSASIDLKVWDYPGPISPADDGSVVKIRGTVDSYRGTPQIVAAKIRLAEEGDVYDTSVLVPVAPIDSSATWNELMDTIDTMSDSDYQSICHWMMRRYGDKFRVLPGGKSVHHSFLNGLLMHTAFMTRTAKLMAEQYADVINRDLLVAGTILHDFAKCEEFTVSPLGIVTDYSVKGQLLGHLVMGAQAIAQAAAELGVPEEKSVLLQHMILSHHGEPEFGAAVRPVCAESELLHIIDLMDSRMEIYRETLGEMEKDTFSPRIFALNKRVFKHN